MRQGTRLGAAPLLLLLLCLAAALPTALCSLRSRRHHRPRREYAPQFPLRVPAQPQLDPYASTVATVRRLADHARRFAFERLGATLNPHINPHDYVRLARDGRVDALTSRVMGQPDYAQRNAEQRKEATEEGADSVGSRAVRVDSPVPMPHAAERVAHLGGPDMWAPEAR